MCGDTDFSTLIDCDAYATVECDLAAYFVCLDEESTCDELTGILDTSGWMNCFDLLECV